MMIAQLPYALVLAFCPQQTPADFDYLPGTWAMIKDGFSFTIDIEPIMQGAGFRSTMTLDENNREVATSIYAFDAGTGSWTRTQFSNTGQRSTFAGGAKPNVLEMRSFRGEALEPVRARLVYTPRSKDEFSLDWQSRADAQSDWTPREVPFVYRRVDRPQPPQGPGRIAFISDRAGNWDIYTMNPDGSDVFNVTQNEAGDHYPNWVAGGRRIAFRSQRGRDDGGWDRWEVDIDGTDAEAVPMPDRLNAPVAGTFPEVHPSGSYLVYATERDGDQNLFISRFDGGGERPLAHAAGLDYRPLWSPSGDRVLFISERDGNAEVYVVGADGQNLKRLTDCGGIDRYARWSPDGQSIVFASDCETGDSLELYVMNADGSDIRRLTENEAEDGEPAWSPDGHWIVFRSNASGNAEVCSVNVESGEIVNLSQNDAYDGEPVWSPLN